MDNIIRIKNLTVEVKGKIILENLNLDIKTNENLILFGPNASGKSTLIKAILGFNNYNIKSGRIIFQNKVINDLSIDQRARLGIGVLFQRPPKIRGITLRQLAGLIGKEKVEQKALIDALNIGHLLDRDLNLNFSGGEMKRSELFQVLIQKPKILLLDEPESGVDIENIALMGKVLNSFTKKYNLTALIITHTGYILDYIEAKKACVVMDRNICCHDSPHKVFSDIRKFGYDKCKKCQCQKK